MTYPMSQNELAMPMPDAGPNSLSCTLWDQQYDGRNLLIVPTDGLGWAGSGHYSSEHDMCKFHWKHCLSFFWLTIFLTWSFNLDQPILFRIGLILFSDDYVTYLLGPRGWSNTGPSNPRLGVKIYIWIGIMEAQAAYGWFHKISFPYLPRFWKHI